MFRRFLSLFKLPFVSRRSYKSQRDRLDTIRLERDYWRRRAECAESLSADRAKKLYEYQRLVKRIQALNIDECVKNIEEMPGS